MLGEMAADDHTDTGFLPVATDVGSAMQQPETDVPVVLVDEERPEEIGNKSYENETAEERLLEGNRRIAAGSIEIAVGGQPALSDGTVYPKQQPPPGSQHALGSCAPDGAYLSSISAEEGTDGSFGAEEEGGRSEGGLEVQASRAAIVGSPLTCRLTVLPDDYLHKLEAHTEMAVGEVIDQLAREFNVAAEFIQIRQEGKVMVQDQTLAARSKEAGLKGPEVCLDLEVVLNCSGDTVPLGKEETVLDNSEGQPMRAAVQVKICTVRQPFLGGYRNKETGVEYLNAAAQCSNPAAVSSSERKLSRDTQTYEKKHVALQSRKEAATQMARRDLLLDESRDRAVLPKAYEDSEHWERRRDHAVVTLQRFWRGWLARRRAEELRVQETEKQQFLVEEQQRRRQAAEAFRRGEIERRLQPRTAADFDILYSELEAWRMQETLKIKESVADETARKPALRQLLHKETKLLQTIDRLKLAAGKENRSTRIARSLASMAAPKQWELRNGTKFEVQTPLTVRAAELMQLYAGLRLRGLRPEQRLDVVQHIKWTVREFDCALTRELLELLAREEDLLARGRPASTLEGLRRRIANLFLQFIETPEFNPEAERFRIAVPDFDAYQNQDPTRRNVRPSEVVL